MRSLSSCGVALLGVALLSGCSSPCRHFDFHEFEPGIYVGCRPRHPEDFAALRQCGIHTILSLETCLWHVAPERKQALENQMNFCSVPIFASPLGPREKSVREALLMLEDRTLPPVYVHCLYGRDRTALILALHRVYFHGIPPETAWRELIQSGYNDGLGLWGFRRYFWHHTHTPDWAQPKTAVDVTGGTKTRVRPP